MHLASARVGVSKRGIQIALAVLWLVDGLLQLQPAMFTRRFATGVIAPNADGQPGFVRAPVNATVHLIELQPHFINYGFALVQILIGLALLRWPHARGPLVASAVWALGIWYLGEGAGGLFAPGPSLMTGAPGAAAIYAVVSLAILFGRGGGTPFWVVWTWAAYWILGTAMLLLPHGMSVSDMLLMNNPDTPTWALALDGWAIPLVGGGVAAMTVIAGLQLLIGAVPALSHRLRRRWLAVAAVSAGIILQTAYWIFVQKFGSFWTGLATDPSTAPAVVLLGFAALCVPEKG